MRCLNPAIQMKKLDRYNISAPPPKLHMREALTLILLLQKVERLKKKVADKALQVDYNIHDDYRLGCFITGAGNDLDRAYRMFKTSLASIMPFSFLVSFQITNEC